MGVTPDYVVMSDAGSGVYSAQYLSNVKGYVTIQIFRYTNGAYVEFYTDKLFSNDSSLNI